MLSICIPVYNFEVLPLINELYIQAKNTSKPYEIIAIDDASNAHFKTLNQKLIEIPGIIYEELENNIGRSKIRNYLCKKASNQYLLFMDCDALITDRNFISNYFLAIDELKNPDSLICGGRNYQKDRPKDSTSLHWVWGNKREAFDASTRSKNPYQSFMTNNFVMPKSVLESNPFNEDLSGYGHEDTLLGFEMKKKNIPIIHIDNPVEHIGLEEASVILEKTIQSTENLLKIYHITNKDKDFVSISKLLKIFEKIRKLKLTKLVRFFFGLFRKTIEGNLKSTKPSILMFDIYKLGIICRL
ncbi:MAG: glycosyltransferase [Bacteroidetes bacterium]|nr:glycosyltransferase [Bacteroidota bacterium]